MLYGLPSLPEARRRGFLWMDEGESDVQTLAYVGIPAVGVPGVATWNDAWAQQLAGIPRIYVAVEPDEAGEQLVAKLAGSPIRGAIWLVSFTPEAKDPSALYLQDPSRFMGPAGAAHGDRHAPCRAGARRADATA